MAIWTLGSINADMVYSVPRLPAPGETVAAGGLRYFLGGKGANMSVAAARAGARVVHVGAVGADGRWAVDRLRQYGVDTDHVAEVAGATGHAVIAVEPGGENSILIYPGANRAIPSRTLGLALSAAQAGDFLLMQNETNLQPEAARMGREMGLKVCYAAAPFDAAAVRAVLPWLDILILNRVEAEQLTQAAGKRPEELPVAHVIVTLGARGARHVDTEKGLSRDFPAFPVRVVDSTGAGDTFTGYLLAGLDRGMEMAQAIDLAGRAAALMVTRAGTADVIPELAEVEAARFG